MNTGQTIAYIAASILIFFGVLVTWGAFGEQEHVEWIAFGVITILVGLGIIWLGRRQVSPTFHPGSTSLKIDLPGNINIETLKCKSCGGSLSSKNIQMVAGAPVVSCPYCQTTYQLTEEPKW